MQQRKIVLRHGSLFSGYGGLDRAVNHVFRSKTAWVSDIDSGACKVLARRFPGVPNLGDITAIDWDAVEPVDIISGGSPCQDLSTAGRRAGMTDGTRSNLWVAMREGIARVRPRYVVWENVRGAYSATATSDLEQQPGLLGDHPAGEPVLRALGRVVGDLADLGYDAQWCGLRASDVGAPHQRYRVFLLGEDTTDAPINAGRIRDGDGGDAADALGEHRGQRRVAAPRQAARGRPRGEPAGRGRASSAHTIGLQPERRRESRDVAGAPGSSEGDSPERQWDGDAAGDRGAATANTDHQGLEGRAAEPERADERLTGQGSLEVQWGQYEQAVHRWERVTGNPAPSPVDDRGRLTARFPEWMMGLPPGWITDVPGVSRTEALRLAGNGVVPQQAVAALTHMINHWESR